MKFTSILAGLVSAAALVQGQDYPDCAEDCFLQVYANNFFELLFCTEANLYLCFCKSTHLPLEYRDCVCDSCPTADVEAALQFGIDTCAANGAPIDWLDAVC